MTKTERKQLKVLKEQNKRDKQEALSALLTDILYANPGEDRKLAVEAYAAYQKENSNEKEIEGKNILGMISNGVTMTCTLITTGAYFILASKGFALEETGGVSSFTLKDVWKNMKPHK